MQIIRQSSFAAAPWKNGGGITYEALRVPASRDAFRWRVSLAHIESSGPFSDFAGYHRYMLLLRGPGLLLKFESGKQRALRQIGEWAEFDGALSTTCELLGGPCVDLNLMVAKPLRAGVRVESVREEFSVPGSPLVSTLIFSVADPLLLHTGAGESFRLEPWDLVVLGRSGVRLGKIEGAIMSEPSAVFFATIGNHAE
jgi:uncharacterized protein